MKPVFYQYVFAGLSVFFALNVMSQKDLNAIALSILAVGFAIASAIIIAFTKEQ